MAGPADLSEVHAALDRLRRQLCHCGMRNECLGCRGVEMVRAQVEAAGAGPSEAPLTHVAQEARMKDMTRRFVGIVEGPLDDPEERQSGEATAAEGLAA